MSTVNNIKFLTSEGTNVTTVADSSTVDGSVFASSGTSLTFTSGSSVDWLTSGSSLITTSPPQFNWNGLGVGTATDFSIWTPSFKTKGAKKPRFNQYFKASISERYFIGSELGDDQVLLFDEIEGEISIQNKAYITRIKKWEYDLQMVYQI